MTSVMSISIDTAIGEALAICTAQDILEQAEDALALLGFGEQGGATCAITRR